MPRNSLAHAWNGLNYYSIFENFLRVEISQILEIFLASPGVELLRILEIFLTSRAIENFTVITRAQWRLTNKKTVLTAQASQNFPFSLSDLPS